MSQANKQLIGFYLWEDLPCQIREDQENPDALHAEVYVKGKGFCPIPMSDILLKASVLSEAEFKQRIIELTTHHGN